MDYYFASPRLLDHGLHYLFEVYFARKVCYHHVFSSTCILLGFLLATPCNCQTSRTRFFAETIND